MTAEHQRGSDASEKLDVLVQLSFAIQDLLARVAARHDLSVTQMRLFGTLRGREPTMGQLKQHLALEKSSVSGLIDRAERRGLVARYAGHPDGRTIHVRLTESGAELAARFAAEVYGELEALLTPLAVDERRELSALAASLLATQVSSFT